ncbi:MAG: S9 family peptidase [Bacteroidales bacterium]|nr:S9 family peptidase [Bacteroidales bacterium]
MKNLISIMAIIMLSTNLFSQKVKYPETMRSNQSDDYFGTIVNDPYRWLEDENSAETKDWVEKQNKVTNEYLSQIPFREAVKNKLENIWNYEKSGIPFTKGPWTFCFRNSGMQNQSILYVRHKKSDTEKILLDPNKLSEDGTTSISGYSISKDNKYFAFRSSKGGSDWNEIQVINIKTGEFLPDKIKWTKFSGIAWYKNGFFYSGYEIEDEAKALSSKNEYHKVFYHKLGTAQSEDILIYENKDFPLRNHYLFLDKKQKYMFLTESEGTSGNSLWFRRASISNGEWTKIADGFEYEYGHIATIKNKFYIRTNDGAENNKLVSVDIKNPSIKNSTIIIPETENVLGSISLINKKLIVNYLKDVYDHLYIYDVSGKLEKEITLPGIGSISSPVGKKNDPNFLFSFTSYTTPSSIYKYNMKEDKTELYWQPKINFNPEEYITEQVFFNSKDGTKIPMFLTHKKDIKLDGNNPVLLYGYGGFNISLTPGFRLTAIPFLEAGGIYAVANLRGGGEYGRKWHLAGTKENKQNVFDDFISAAEYLIEKKYTNFSKIAIQGGSNGGLLVGACMAQRPDLFKVALPAVGVMDMLRFHKFTIGWAWTGDYGSSDNEADFKYLYKYSPLHNLKPANNYPATLVTTADHDDRVVPAHSYKFISELQHANKGANPTLIRIETMSGHGAGKPTSKQIEEATDVLSFMMYNLGMNYR